MAREADSSRHSEADLLLLGLAIQYLERALEYWAKSDSPTKHAHISSIDHQAAWCRRRLRNMRELMRAAQASAEEIAFAAEARRSMPVDLELERLGQIVTVLSNGNTMRTETK